MRSHLLPIVVSLAIAAPTLAGAQNPPSGGNTGTQGSSGASPTATSGASGSTGGVTGTSGTTAPAPAAPARSRRLVTGDYKLTAGDKLRVEVYKDAQLSQSLQVRPDGKITLPLVGDIAASGLTPLELRDQIAGALKEYVTNPVVTVIVVETVPPEVYVMGEVGNPGAIPMNGPMTVLQALARAGGFKDFANTKGIRVLRRAPSGVQTIPFNYKDAVKGEHEDLRLEPGDTVIVP